jgi:hypothetical protein
MLTSPRSGRADKLPTAGRPRATDKKHTLLKKISQFVWRFDAAADTILVWVSGHGL